MPFKFQRLGLQALFLISGAPGLAAQLTWTRVFSAGLGHELPSLLGVVSAFFAGLAAGAWVWDGPVRRSARPALWYAALEAGSALWILLMLPALGALNGLAAAWIGPEAGGFWRGIVAFAVPLAVVGPAALAMGGTLPAMERAVAPLLGDGRAVAGLYALNTTGAVLGTLGAVFVSMPRLGFQGTLVLAAAMQALLALAVGVMGCRRQAPGRDLSRAARAPVAGSIPRRLAPMAFATGLLGLGFELLGVRALAQVTENTVHTYAIGLSVFLVGTAGGAAALRWGQRRGVEVVYGTLFGAASMAILASMALIAVGAGGKETLRRVLGVSGAEVGLSLAMFLVPSMVMGALFARLAQEAGDTGVGVGRVMAWNTLGGALAAPLIMCVWLPWVGIKTALLSVALGYLGGLRPRETSGWRWAIPAVVLASIPLLPARLRLLDLPPGGAEVRRLEEGALATVTVVRTPDGHRTLRVNNRFQQGGTGTALAAKRHAVLPLLLHDDGSRPRRALFLGVGTGITLGAAAAFPGTAVDGVELLPEVLRVLPEFEPENGAPLRQSEFRLICADARRFVRTTDRRYDVVVADLFHPSEDGAGFLYTREHFAAVRARLAPGGLFCQWLPLHQLDQATFRTVVRTFRDVFPEATLWLLRSNADIPVVGLVWVEGGLRVDWGRVDRWLAGREAGSVLREVALGDAMRLYGSLLADARSLERIGGAGPVATDDLPRVLYQAARAVYADPPNPGKNLAWLLGEADPGFQESAPGRWGDHGPRLRSYRDARDHHLQGLVLEMDGRRLEALEHYVASASASPDYTAGYGQAVLVASAYRREDPRFARELLERLIQARPEQRLARDVLARLGE